MLYSNIVYQIILLFLFIKFVSSKYNLLHIYVFLIPFHSWFYDFGLNLSMAQIVNLVMIFILPFAILKKNINLKFGSNYIGLFLVYTFFNTIIISLFFIDKYQIIGGFFRSEGRFIGQLALLFIKFSKIPLSFIYIKNLESLKKIIQIYLFSLIILCFLGITQFIVFYIFGIDLFPLDINEFGETKSATYYFSGNSLFRISSLGGEPKGFSLSLIIGYFIIKVFNLNNITFFKNDFFIKYLFLMIAFATVSTSAFVLFLILMFFYIFFIKSNSFMKNRFFKINNFYNIIILVTIGFFIYRYFDLFSIIIEQRIFERNIVGEDYDMVIRTFLNKFPEYLFFGSGQGNIHNLAYPYIPFEYLHYMEDNIFVAKSGYLRIISELGIIGFVLYSLIFYNVYKKLNKFKTFINNSLSSRFVHAMQSILVLCLVSYFSRIYLESELLLFLALCNFLAFSKSVRSKNKIIYSQNILK